MGVYTGKRVVATARVFKSGNSQAVRLPKEFRFKGTEVEISRRGEEVVLREKPKQKRGLRELFNVIAGMPEGVFEGTKDKRPPQRRKGL